MRTASPRERAMSHHEDTPSLSSLTCGLSAVGPLLDSCGYAVLDGLLPSCFALALRDEMATLHRQQLLRPHRFGFKSSPSAPVRLVRKPHIYEAELSEPHVREHAASIGTVSELVATAAGAAFPELQLCPGPNGEGTAVKLQCNEGHGGCFPLHFDNAGPPSCRKLTCLVYLNPHWQPADGGELQIWPPDGGPPVVVAPRADRLVLFVSSLEHEVLPAWRPRYALTTWMFNRRHTALEAFAEDMRQKKAEGKFNTAALLAAIDADSDFDSEEEEEEEAEDVDPKAAKLMLLRLMMQKKKSAAAAALKEASATAAA